MIVCFVSGNFGFSFGKCTLGAIRSPAGAQIDCFLAATMSGTVTPPAIIGECVPIRNAGSGAVAIVTKQLQYFPPYGTVVLQHIPSH